MERKELEKLIKEEFKSFNGITIEDNDSTWVDTYSLDWMNIDEFVNMFFDDYAVDLNGVCGTDYDKYSVSFIADVIERNDITLF